MILKELRDEDFINYKKPSLFLGFPICSFKCEKECGERCCQNSVLAQSPDFDITNASLIKRYMDNEITKSVVCGGLDPIDSWDELYDFIKDFRKYSNDDIVIYTGYREEEISKKIKLLAQIPNIIVKFGRFIPE